MGEIVSRFERKGWKLIALKMLTPTPSLVERHYEEHAGKVKYCGEKINRGGNIGYFLLCDRLLHMTRKTGLVRGMQTRIRSQTERQRDRDKRQETDVVNSLLGPVRGRFSVVLTLQSAGSATAVG